MNLKKHWQRLSPAKRSEIAAACGTSEQYLYLIFYGHKQAGARLAPKIEAATNGRISRDCLRPDVFGPAAQ